MGADFDEWRKAVVIAGGSSLTEEQCQAVNVARAEQQVRTFAVNQAWLRLLQVDVLYAADSEWWEMHKSKLHVRMPYIGEEYTASQEAARKYGIEKLRAKAHAGINFDASTRIVTGQNSGQQALNLAVLKGAKQIILLGYDMKAQWHRNWHDPYPTDFMNREQDFKHWIEDMDRAAEDLKAHCIDVVNCSIDTALTCFRRSTIDDALAA